MGFLLFVVSSLCAGVLAWRALRESCLLLICALGPLLGSSFLVALSNAKVPPTGSLALLAIITVVVGFWPGGVRPNWTPLGRGAAWGLGIVSALVVFYTHYHGVHVLDSDRWLHDAQINAFRRGIYPPVNPLFPELAMNGHFGRDLYIATLSPQGSDPAMTIFWVQPLIQLATFLLIFASTRSMTDSVSRGFLVSGMLFFGMDCGFRVGLLDTFDGSNGLAYPHLVLLFHLMMRIQQGSGWPTWLLAGLALGTYQLVYMTNFALLLLSGFVIFLLTARSKKAWLGLVLTGLLAMGLAVTEGGAFTDLAQRGLNPELHNAVQNQGLRVSVSFPKENLFTVMTSTADYYRTSVAYKTSLFQGLYKPPSGEGAVSIFSLDFMRVHWLPLYLAPLTLWCLRRSPLGLAYWTVGAVSYLLPGLFYFGPIFEYEYYRFEFSAAFGFAGALGLALAQWLENRPILFSRSPYPTVTFAPGSARYLAACAVLVASLAAGEKALNDAVINSQKSGFQWFPNARKWRLSEPTFGMTPDILDACDWLKERTEPGQRVLTNFLTDRPMGLWPDVVAATLAGVFPAGHSYTSETEGGPHGNPAFHQNAIYRVFWASGELSVIEDDKIHWLLCDSREVKPEVREKLQALSPTRFGDIWVIEVPSRAAVPNPSQWELTAPPKPQSNEALRLGQAFPLSATVSNKGGESRAVVALDTILVEPLRFFVPADGGEIEMAFVTPLDEGTYSASVQDLEGQERFKFSFTVDFLTRLSELSCQLDFPQLKANRLYTIKGRWVSTKPIHSEGELELSYRFKRPEGEYAWEVDMLPQPIDLALPQEPNFEFLMHTPKQAGSYQLELWFFDRGSGRLVEIDAAFQVGVES